MTRSNRLTLPLALLVACALPAAAIQSAQTPASPPAHKPATTASHSAAHGSHAKHHPREPRGQIAPTPDRITEIQTALARENAYQGDPNGKWDAATIDAMKRFQAAQGLAPTGKIDAPTLQRLGLGSDVAGKGAPTPLATPDAPAAQSPSAQSPSASIQSDTQLR
ncbi:MAG: peptidoglycan-binding domain-containing protein [Candidatus Acidiferrales bacterium]|jgi:peptidoglycan hydrolase-like protein with peptidoglycan-binding domain